MSKSRHVTPGQYLKQCSMDLEKARKKGEKKQISLALANLGFALFQARKFEEGLTQFEESQELAQKFGDVSLQAQCLGVKTLAFQLIGRLPDAFETAGQVLALGEKHADPGLKCDALASQGQILLDSGEPILAFDKLKQAREIANEIEDKRRQMNVFGALGNYSLAITSVDQAQTYFERALALAHELNDKSTEIGYTGNVGAALAWQGKHKKAIPYFEQVLAHVRQTNELGPEVQVLRHLAVAYNELENDEKVLEYALQGLTLAKDEDDETALSLAELLIKVNYRLNKIEEAQQITRDATEIAKKMKNSTKEIDLLLSLGESYFLMGNYQDALQIYQKALVGAQQLDRNKDAAYLTGRIGITYAELGQLDEAIRYHKEALSLAQDRDLLQLEGEQLTMLSMAYLEMDDVDRAREHVQSAIKVYSDAEMDDETEKARQLLKKIDAK